MTGGHALERGHGFSARAPLRLRPLRTDDETVFLDAHRALAAEGFTFGLGFEPGTPWTAYLRSLEEQRAGTNLPAGKVPATFLVAEVAGKIVGRTSIRHILNDRLAQEGGHIGYGVLPQHRRRGYATEMLRQSLVIAREHGSQDVLVTCDDDNMGSIAVIEACGGRLESTIHSTPGAPPTRRYWFDRPCR